MAGWGSARQSFLSKQQARHVTIVSHRFRFIACRLRVHKFIGAQREFSRAVRSGIPVQSGTVGDVFGGICVERRSDRAFVEAQILSKRALSPQGTLGKAGVAPLYDLVAMILWISSFVM
jgi:hypothetical protein